MLQGGIASVLFPVSPLCLGTSPASLALLESWCVAASISRPFGLRRLDRSALAASITFDDLALGIGASATGDGDYAELTLRTSGAWKLFRGVAAGAGLNLHHLQISGYGRATGGSLDLALVWSPVPGLYGLGQMRSLLRTDLGSSGDPAAPRVVEFAAGAVPVEGVTVAAAVSGQEGLDPEYSLQAGFSPVEALSLTAGFRTGPSRFWAALWFSYSSAGLQYGYGEHSRLPGSHSLALSWGRCRSRLQPLELTGPVDEEEGGETEFPINVNSATEEELMAIPGIGPSKASALAAWIRQNGPVQDLRRLEEVPGIGPSLMETLSRYLVAE